MAHIQPSSQDELETRREQALLRIIELRNRAAVIPNGSLYNPYFSSLHNLILGVDTLIEMDWFVERMIMGAESLIALVEKRISP
jgi:hypothetical protein